MRPTFTRALALVELIPAHGHAVSLRALKVRNPEEPAISEKQLAGFGVHTYETNRWIDVVALGSTNVEQML